jgi:hypothetical protein
MLATVPNDAPNAEAQWITLDASVPAGVTYQRERRDTPPEEFPARWLRTCEVFAAHVPAGHHLIRVDMTSMPASQIAANNR